MSTSPPTFFLFIFNATPPTQIYTLSLHDALPISQGDDREIVALEPQGRRAEQHTEERGDQARYRQHQPERHGEMDVIRRSEEHTSELQSRFDLVCRLLLEKKKK